MLNVCFVVFSETILVFSHINIDPTTRVEVGGLDPQGCQFILGGAERAETALIYEISCQDRRNSCFRFFFTPQRSENCLDLQSSRLLRRGLRPPHVGTTTLAFYPEKTHVVKGGT